MESDHEPNNHEEDKSLLSNMADIVEPVKNLGEHVVNAGEQVINVGEQVVETAFDKAKRIGGAVVAAVRVAFTGNH